MRQRDKLNVATLILVIVGGLALDFYFHWPFALILMASGVFAAFQIYANVIYEGRVQAPAKAKEKAEKKDAVLSPVPAAEEKKDAVLSPVPAAEEKKPEITEEKPRIPKYCTKCGQKVSPGDERCPKCGYELRPAAPPRPEPAVIEAVSRPMIPLYCTNCGAKINPREDNCPDCGYDLRPNKENAGVRKVAGSTELVVEDRKLPIAVYDFCNGLVAFQDKELKVMDVRMEGAKAMVAQGKISLAKFSEFIKQEEVEANNLVLKSDAKLKEIEAWVEALDNRATYARTQLDDAELSALSNRPEDAEVTRSKKNLFNLELQIVSKVLDWLAALETGIRVSKHSIESKLREAFLAAIPVTAMVPAGAPRGSALEVGPQGQEGA